MEIAPAPCTEFQDGLGGKLKSTLEWPHYSGTPLKGHLWNEDTP